MNVQQRPFSQLQAVWDAWMQLEGDRWWPRPTADPPRGQQLNPLHTQCPGPAACRSAVGDTGGQHCDRARQTNGVHLRGSPQPQGRRKIADRIVILIIAAATGGLATYFDTTYSSSF